MRIGKDEQLIQLWYPRIIISNFVNGSITQQVQQNIKQFFMIYDKAMWFYIGKLNNDYTVFIYS